MKKAILVLCALALPVVLFLAVLDLGRTAAPAAGERMRFTVTHLHPQGVVLVPQAGDSAVVVHPDSLSLTIRQGEIVRRCNRPTTDGRTVTWCRDTKANAARR